MTIIPSLCGLERPPGHGSAGGRAGTDESDRNGGPVAAGLPTQGDGRNKAEALCPPTGLSEAVPTHPPGRLSLAGTVCSTWQVTARRPR